MDDRMDDETGNAQVNMDMNVGFLISGLLIGSILSAFIVHYMLSKSSAALEGRATGAEAVKDELRQQVEQLKQELSDAQSDFKNESEMRAAVEARYHESEKNLQSMEKQLIDKFSTISLDALSKNSAEFIKLAEEKLKSHTVEGTKELEGKKDLIEKSLSEMDKTLTDVKKRVEDVNKGNIKVSALVENHEKLTSRLMDTTDHLTQALASSKKRGEWGERMAEDIINLVGMIEGVNYVKQKTLEGSSGRPDYTFLMPNNLKLNMDVKFPLDNYVKYLNADSENDRKRYKDELLKSTKIMIKDVTSREYINPADNTVDYVLVFIPNEQVYGFINESDATIMDVALKQKVVLCSPFTLYAVLAVIRQSIENFNLDQATAEIQKLLGNFYKQWDLYKRSFDNMGKKLDEAKREYEALVTTRTNKLEVPLRKIEDLRKQKSIELNSDNNETSMLE
jgi:DNA recombination protein RmuC